MNLKLKDKFWNNTKREKSIKFKDNNEDEKPSAESTKVSDDEGTKYR